MSKKKRDVVNELHRPARINFKRRNFNMKGINETFQADLVEMPYKEENKGYRYILVVIDTFSKYVWAEPLENKTGDEVSKAMQKIFSKDKRIPKKCKQMRGKNFTTRILKN